MIQKSTVHLRLSAICLISAGLYSLTHITHSTLCFVTALFPSLVSILICFQTNIPLWIIYNDSYVLLTLNDAFQEKPSVELCCFFVVLLKQTNQVIQITVYFHRHNHNCSLKPHLNFHTVVWLPAPYNVFNRVFWKDICRG